MNNSIDLNFKYNEFGVGECYPEAKASIDPGLKLKLEGWVHKILEEIPSIQDSIETIKIQKIKDAVHITINDKEGRIYLGKKFDEIMVGAKEVFSEQAASGCANVAVISPNPLHRECP